MLLMCRIDRVAMAKRIGSQVHPMIHCVAEAALSAAGCKVLESSSDGDVISSVTDIPRGVAEWCDEVDDEGGALSPHGIVDLCRLVGHSAESRFKKGFYVVRCGGQVRACARVCLDVRDRRCRILGCRSDRIDAIIIILNRIIGDMRPLSGASVAIDVAVGALATIDELAKLGFRATAYYPALLATNNGRCDAVQLTWCDPSLMNDIRRQNVAESTWSNEEKLVFEAVVSGLESKQCRTVGSSCKRIDSVL